MSDELPTHDSIRGTCQSCEFYYRDGDRAWWGSCRLADIPDDSDDDSDMTTHDWDSCDKYKESDKVAKEAIDRWHLLNVLL